MRSKGIDYYDWCMDIRTTDNDYIRVRPPRQAEMTRWLATLNLYCAPAAKRNPNRPRRKQVVEGGQAESPSRHSVPASPKPNGEGGARRSPKAGATTKPPPPFEPEGGPGSSWDIPAHKPRPPRSPRPADQPPSPRPATGGLPLSPSNGGLSRNDSISSRRSLEFSDSSRRSMDFGDVAQQAVTHTGLLAGWSSNSGSSLGPGQPAAQANAMPRQRRALSFTRRRPEKLAMVVQANPKPAASRGGRLQTTRPQTKHPAAEPLQPSAAHARLLVGDASNAAVGGGAPQPVPKQAIRRPSFGRRRSTSYRTSSQSSVEAQPVAVRTDLIGAPAAESTSAQRPPLMTRALSFGRGRRATRNGVPDVVVPTRNLVTCDSSAEDASVAQPPGLPPPPRARRADAAAPVPLSKSPTDFASDGSSESSERPVGSGPGNPARADSFGQKLRRAASFSSARRRKTYEETSLSSVH